jgi:hypothetical protein
VSRLSVYAILAVLVLGAAHLKLRLSTNLPRFDAEDETGYFRAESALQYRYARFAAAGLPAPEVDRAAQWPEGIRTRRELTGLMERLTGLSYRRLAPRGTDFRWFVLLWSAFVSSLSIGALYACAVRLSRSPAVALAACAAYGLSWAAQSDLIGSYRLETLGLPLLFSSLACCAAVLDPEEKRPRAYGAAAAALVLAAFATWHLTRFYVATYELACLWAYWRTKDRRLRYAAAYPLAGAALALLLLPSARASSYGHVYGLLWAKLAHGLRHPADPAALDAISRLEWTGPSNSPDAGFALFALFPLALALAPRLRGKTEPSAFGSLADALTAVYAAATLLASRMTPWLAFFLVLSAVRTPRAAWLAALGALEALKCLAPSSPFNPVLALSAAVSKPTLRPAVGLSSERQVLSWLRRYGGAAHPTLAPMGLSAQILAYADTPVLLQPKWEAAGIRAKTAEFARALFLDEEAFAAYCRRYGAQLFVYGADTLLDETPEGLRYASGRMQVSEHSAAYLFHFEPERLRSFRMVFQNEDYRVYALMPNKGEPAPRLPVYDRMQYGPALDCKQVLRRMEASRLKLVLARVFGEMGRGPEALTAYEQAFTLWPPDEASRREYEALRSASIRARRKK